MLNIQIADDNSSSNSSSTKNGQTDFVSQFSFKQQSQSVSKPAKIGTTASTRRNRIAYEDEEDEDEDEDIVPLSRRPNSKKAKQAHSQNEEDAEDAEDEANSKKNAFSIFKKVANKKKIGL